MIVWFATWTYLNLATVDEESLSNLPFLRRLVVTAAALVLIGSGLTTATIVNWLLRRRPQDAT
jgi:hypothetical protein